MSSGYHTLPPALSHSEKRDASSQKVSSFFIRGLITFLLSTIFVFPQFGINFGNYSANFSLLATYGLLLVFLFVGAVRPAGSMVMLYWLVALCGTTSLYANSWGPSASSFFLLLAIYFPFLFGAKPEVTAQFQIFAVRRYCDFAAIIGLIGCLQFSAQFVISDRWLFGFAEYIPEAIKGSGVYNAVIQIGSLKKSNGFFLREPSELSLVSSIALLCEYYYFRRYLRIVILILAMVVSYSGTGIIVLLFGLFFPSGFNTISRLVLIGGAFSLAYWGLAEALNLSIFTDRLEEFGTQGSSGYARFVAPFELISREFDYPEWAPWVGHGPGSILRTIGALRTTFETNDPTWAKMIFEYGILGSVAILVFFIRGLWVRVGTLELKAALLYAWLASGGQLLSPDFTAIVFLLMTLWPMNNIQLRATSGDVAPRT